MHSRNLDHSTRYSGNRHGTRASGLTTLAAYGLKLATVQAIILLPAHWKMSGLIDMMLDFSYNPETRKGVGYGAL